MNDIIVPLLDLIDLKGEENVLGILSRFSCEGKNDEVEVYLKETAIRHTRKNTSITHLVMTPDCSECLAYYTLAIKPFAIAAGRLNNRQRKEMRDVAKMRRRFELARRLRRLMKRRRLLQVRPQTGHR